MHFRRIIRTTYTTKYVESRFRQKLKENDLPIKTKKRGLKTASNRLIKGIAHKTLNIYETFFLCTFHPLTTNWHKSKQKIYNYD